MPNEEMERGFGLSTATYTVVASMVGVGILTTSGYTIKDTGSHTVLLALWLVGGLLAMSGALTVAELAAAMPYAGGEYVFIRETYGKPPAFLYGWISFLIGFSAPAAIASHAAASYLVGPWLDTDDADSYLVIHSLAVLLIVALTLFHLRGRRVSSWVQDLSTLLKVGLLVAFVIAGFVWGRGDLGHLSSNTHTGGLRWSVLAISLVYVMYGYTGWNAATYIAGEIRDPDRNLPRSLLLGCGGVVVLYLVINLLYAYALPTEEVVAMSYHQVEPIAAVAAERLFGPWISAILSVAIGVGLLATASAFVMIGPRVYFAMARDGLFPSMAGTLSPKTGTPNNATLAQAAGTLALLFTGTFKDILTYAGIGLSISAFFVILSVFVLRIWRPDMPRPFKTPGYPVVPLVFLACVLWMIVFAFQNQPLWSTISIASILAGVPVYYVWQAVQRGRETRGNAR